MCNAFAGFSTEENSLTGIPDVFLRELMPAIEDANLLKLCLYVLWKANTVGDYQIAFTRDNLMLDRILMNGLKGNEIEEATLVDDLLEKLARAKVLLRSDEESKTGYTYFINCAEGRAAAGTRSSNITLDQVQPNIYQIYTENIGPLTPLIADALKDAQATYPQGWIQEAIEIAVTNNVRRWRYVESILDRWQKEGRNGTDRKHDKTDYRSYLDD
jgi:DnaD/phage-associated family protein